MKLLNFFGGMPNMVGDWVGGFSGSLPSSPCSSSDSSRIESGGQSWGMEMLSELWRPLLEEDLQAMSSLLRLLKGFSGSARPLEAALAAMPDRLAKDLDLPVKKFDNPLLEIHKEERSMQDYNYINPSM